MQQNSTLTLNDYESGYGYSQEGMKILTVGDGDFSFSLALARIMMCRRKSTKNACRVEPKSRRQEDDETCRLLEIETCLVATSYEAFETLHRVYPDIQKTLDELERLNVLVCFNVDATDLLGTLPISVQNRVASFHRVIWNFPCTAIANGQDGQNQQMQDNQMLVRKFVNQCRNFLHPVQGEIHFMHKTKPPYDQWKLEEIAVQDLDQDDKNEVMQQDEANKGPCSCRIVYKGRVVFDRCLLLPYIPRKALDKKSFPCHDACLFVFGWGCLPPASMGKSITTSSRINIDQSVVSPTIPLDLNSSCEEDAMLPVTEQMIDEIKAIQMALGSYKDRKNRCTIDGDYDKARKKKRNGRVV
jgi:Domain of unknown function (DUF2431).